MIFWAALKVWEHKVSQGYMTNDRVEEIGIDLQVIASYKSLQVLYLAKSCLTSSMILAFCSADCILFLRKYNYRFGSWEISSFLIENYLLLLNSSFSRIQCSFKILLFPNFQSLTVDFSDSNLVQTTPALSCNFFRIASSSQYQCLQSFSLVSILCHPVYFFYWVQFWLVRNVCY